MAFAVNCLSPLLGKSLSYPSGNSNTSQPFRCLYTETLQLFYRNVHETLSSETKMLHLKTETRPKLSKKCLKSISKLRCSSQDCIPVVASHGQPLLQ